MKNLPPSNPRLGLLFFVFVAVGSLPAGGQSPIALPETQVQLDLIESPAMSGQKSFTLGSSGDLTFEIATSDTNLIVSISGPAGQTVDSTNIGTVSGEYAEYDLGAEGYYQLFVFPSLGAGTYSVQYSLPSAPAQPTPVELHAIERSGLGATLVANEPQVAVGQEVPLTAAVFDEDVPLTGLAITAEVLLGAGPPIPVPLLDDGSGFDDAVGENRGKPGQPQFDRKCPSFALGRYPGLLLRRCSVRTHTVRAYEEPSMAIIEAVPVSPSRFRHN